MSTSRFGSLFLVAALALPLLSAPGLAREADLPADGLHLIFYGTETWHKEEAENIQLAYQKKGWKVEAPVNASAEEILATIEKHGKAGTRIASVTLVSHGTMAGPRCTRTSRMNYKIVEQWRDKLVAAGTNPRSFFSPGATISLRACYVGRGPVPRKLASILPDAGKVESDIGFYKTFELGGRLGGLGSWSRQRISQRDKDYYLDGGKQKPTFDFTGTWTSRINGTMKLEQRSLYSAEEEGAEIKFLEGRVTGSFGGKAGETWGNNPGRISGTPADDSSGAARVDPETGELQVHVSFDDGTSADLKVKFPRPDGSVLSGSITYFKPDGQTSGVISAKRAD